MIGKKECLGFCIGCPQHALTTTRKINPAQMQALCTMGTAHTVILKNRVFGGRAIFDQEKFQRNVSRILGSRA